MIGVMMLVMIGIMTMFGFMLGKSNPLAMMFPGFETGISGMWQMMVIPLLGLIIMLAMMYYIFRWMTGGKGLMTGMMGADPKQQVQAERKNLTTMTFSY